MSQNDVMQIKIGRHMTGLIGLKAVFEAVAEGHDNGSDELLTQRLLEKTAEKNYIPDPARDDYSKALLREFKKFIGAPVQTEESAEGLNIKVLGAGCNICDGIENDLMAVLAEMDLPADLEHVRDPAEIARYKVLGTPAIAINGKVVSTGGAPAREQLRRWIETAIGDMPKEKNAAHRH